MQEFPQGGLLGKMQHFIYRIVRLRIPLYAANASFFLVLSVFPGLLLLLSLLQYTPLDVEYLTEVMEVLLPEPFLEGAEELILTTYDGPSHTLVGISAVTALWSASRGIYSLLTGLNGVYGVRETRNWLHKRILSAMYTFAFLLVCLVSLGLHIFGTQLLQALSVARWPFLRFLSTVVDWGVVLALLLQTGLFGAMFLALPNRRSHFKEVLPGAVLASLGWLVFSKGYGLYLQLFAARRSLYGSVYALSLAMLWLYFCVCIVFYGGGLNALLLRHKHNDKL